MRFLVLRNKDDFYTLLEYTQTLDIDGKDKEFFYQYMKEIDVIPYMIEDLPYNQKHIRFGVVNMFGDDNDIIKKLIIDVKYAREICNK